MAQLVARTGRQPRRQGWGRPLRRAVLYAVLVALALVFITPLLWMLSTSFKADYEATQYPLTWLPHAVTGQAYATIFNSDQAPILRWFVNSVVAATGQTLLVLVTASTAAYPLARMEFRGKGVMFALIISTLFIPPVIFLIPNYLIVDHFGWLNTLWAIIVPGAAGAFGVFFLRQFFSSLPRELEEAALIDRANRFQIFTRIIVPLSKSALATLAVLSFLTNWNDFLWPIYVLFSPQNLTLQPGLAALQSAYGQHYPAIMAGGVIASIPVLILFIVAQRYIVEGVARSGLKG